MAVDWFSVFLYLFVGAGYAGIRPDAANKVLYRHRSSPTANRHSPELPDHLHGLDVP